MRIAMERAGSAAIAFYAKPLSVVHHSEMLYSGCGWPQGDKMTPAVPPITGFMCDLGGGGRNAPPRYGTALIMRKRAGPLARRESASDWLRFFVAPAFAEELPVNPDVKEAAI